MLIYNEKGEEANCDASQLAIMERAGWTRSKPRAMEEAEPEQEEKPAPVKMTPAAKKIAAKK